MIFATLTLLFTLFASFMGTLAAPTSLMGRSVTYHPSRSTVDDTDIARRSPALNDVPLLHLPFVHINTERDEPELGVRAGPITYVPVQLVKKNEMQRDMQERAEQPSTRATRFAKRVEAMKNRMVEGELD